MKKNTLILLALLCSYALSAQTKSHKRGFGGDVLNTADAQAVSKLQWYYNWGQTPNATVKSNVQNYLEYVPMTWGAGFDSAALVNYLSQHHEVKYLLGFNEPNFIEQANLTPHQAAALWPKVEAIADRFHLKLVSPAVNYSYSGGAVIENGMEYINPVTYLDSFFAACPGCRVDYIAVHGYFDDPAGLAWYIDQFRKYHKGIWLTEFNQSAWWVNATTQQNYLVDASAYLEKDTSIFRYAWFLSRSTQLNTNLFDTSTTGVLTDLGKIYVNLSSFDTTYYHSASDTIQAEHFSDMSGVHCIVVQDSSGILATQDFDSLDWMDYRVRLTTSGSYTLKFRVTSIFASSFKLYDGNTLLTTVTVPNTGGFEAWQTITASATLTAGKHRFRIVTNGGGWKFNWWKISAGSAGASAMVAEKSQTAETIKSIRIYPNPVTNGVFNIETSWTDYSVQIFNVSGQSVLNSQHNAGTKTIPVSNLAPGTYIVLVSENGKRISSKILVDSNNR